MLLHSGQVVISSWSSKAGLCKQIAIIQSGSDKDAKAPVEECVKLVHKVDVCRGPLATAAPYFLSRSCEMKRIHKLCAHSVWVEWKIISYQIWRREVSLQNSRAIPSFWGWVKPGSSPSRCQAMDQHLDIITLLMIIKLERDIKLVIISTLMILDPVLPDDFSQWSYIFIKEEG